MYVKALYAAALFSSSLAAIVTLPASSSASASDPTITPVPNLELLRKQNDARYMGWIYDSDSGDWTSQNCDSGGTYFQDKGHWACCATEDAGCGDLPQACVSGRLVYDSVSDGVSTSTTVACSSRNSESYQRPWTICNTALMYENYRDSNPQTRILCGSSSVFWSIYREKPPVPVVIPSTTSTTPTVSDGTDTTPTPTPVPDNPTSSSKAWIAGAVVGPIVGLALVCTLIWFYLRRRKKNNVANGLAPPPQYYSPPMQQPGPVMAPFGVTDGKQVLPTSQASSPDPLSMYAGQYPQQGGHAGPAQQAYSEPSPGSPSLSAYASNSATYSPTQASEPVPFSNELDTKPQR